VSFKGDSAGTTKREVLKSLASVSDPLGLANPTVLVVTRVYRKACDQRLPWDALLPEKLAKQWGNFKKSLPDEVKVPRRSSPSQRTSPGH